MPTIKNRGIIKLLSGLLNILICLIATTVILFWQDWFGSGDMYSFLFWTVPLAIGLSVSGATILNLFRSTHVLLKLFLIILTAVFISFGWVCFIYLILGGMIYTFSIPIFYLWIGACIIQLIFLDTFLPNPVEKPKVFKLVLRILLFPVTLLVVVVTMFLLSSLGSYLTKPEKVTFLIPNDFEGEFIVIYGEKCGINPTFEEGRRLLKVPDNGVLIIQPAFKAGTIDNEYYLVDRDGNRKRMNELWNYKLRKTQAPGVLMGSSGSMLGAMPDGSASSESPSAIHFTTFMVFNKDTTTRNDKEAFKYQQHFDSLIHVLVDDCRKNLSF